MERHTLGYMWLTTSPTVSNGRMEPLKTSNNMHYVKLGRFSAGPLVVSTRPDSAHK